MSAITTIIKFILKKRKKPPFSNRPRKSSRIKEKDFGGVEAGHPRDETLGGMNNPRSGKSQVKRGNDPKIFVESLNRGSKQSANFTEKGGSTKFFQAASKHGFKKSVERRRGERRK